MTQFCEWKWSTTILESSLMIMYDVVLVLESKVDCSKSYTSPSATWSCDLNLATFAMIKMTHTPSLENEAL